MEEQQGEQPVTASAKQVEEVFTYSEYINTVKVVRAEEDFKLLKPLPELTPNSDELRSLSPYSFRQLAIQFFYLLYSCWHTQIVPVPEDDSKFLCYSYESGNVVLCLTEFVTFDSSVIRNYETGTPYFTYYSNFIRAMKEHWKAAEQRNQKTSKHKELSCEYFCQRVQAISADKMISGEKEAFSTLEKENVFEETSILLRINKSSLVCVMRKCPALIELYKKHRLVENTLSEEYNQRKKRKNNLEKLLETEKSIQNNIQEFFFSLKTNPSYFKPEDRRKKETSPIAVNRLLLGLKVYEQASDSQSGTQQQHAQFHQDFYNSYEIEYYSNRNLVVVRMLTDLVLDWATSDSILFKWNTLTFETSNVGLETIEKMDEQKKLKKYIVVRGTCYLSKKEPVLEKILTLIDITMATFKSIELEMKSEAFFAKNLNKIEESYSKINHYLKAIHKCCLKSYAAITSPSSE